MQTSEFLSQMLAEGRLVSRYEDGLEKQRRYSDSSYRQIVQTSGREAAEKMLQDVDKIHHISMFASLLVPIVQGLANLSRIDDRTFVMTLKGREHIYGMRQHLGSVIFFNATNTPDCGCVQSKGADVFSVYGRLGLQAITLTVGTHQEGGSYANLGIVFLPSCIAKNSDSHQKNGYKVFSIDLFGYTNWSQHIPSLISPMSYLKYTFGVCTADDLIGYSKTSGGHADDLLGFPGAYDYLVKVLPDLGPYLSDLADKLSKEHKHK